MKIKRDLCFAAVCVMACIIGWNLPVSASGITQQAYNLIQNSGSALARESTLNFTGAGVSCADAAPVTTCTISGGGGGGNPTITVANAGTTGTTTSTLTKLTGAPSTAVIAATSDTGGVVGITSAGAGTTGSATITIAGQLNCVFDGSTTAGDYVQISSTTAGNCHDTGSSTYPTSGQILGRVLSSNVGAGTYQLDLFPSEIKGSSGGGGGGLTAAPPYLTDSTNYFIAATGYQVTKPVASPTFINSVSPTLTSGVNGDLLMVGTGVYWYELTATASAESVFTQSAVNTNSTFGTAGWSWLWDSANNLIYSCGTNSVNGNFEWEFNTWTYNGTGNPAFSTNLGTWYTLPGMPVVHTKLVVSAGTATCEYSLDGGATFTVLATHAIGTISDGGVGMGDNGDTTVVDVLSLKVS